MFVIVEVQGEDILTAELTLAKKWLDTKEKLHDNKKVTVQELNSFNRVDKWMQGLPKNKFNEIVNWVA